MRYFMDMLVNIGTEGKVTGLHFDEFDLGFLGNKKIDRASEIFFNERTQSWDVQLPQQYVPFEACTGFDSYNEARKFEVLWLQECMETQADPHSKGGGFLALRIRELTF